MTMAVGIDFDHPAPEGIKEWLEHLDNPCHDVMPVRATFVAGGNDRRWDETYIGCRYKQDYTLEPGWYMPGGMKPERRITQEAIYLLGKLPRCYRRSRRVCFRIAGDDREWFVAGYSGVPGRTEYQPFGPALYLHPWTHGSIDEGEDWRYGPYRRVELKVEETT